MRDLLGWSLPVVRVQGVTLRLHAFFLLAAAYVLHLSAATPLNPFDRSLGTHWRYGVALVATLLVSVLAHELAHLWVARRFGGQVEQLVLWPFGGLALASVSPRPGPEIMVSLAGPLVNLLLGALAALALAASGESDLTTYLNPLLPPLALTNRSATMDWPQIAGLALWVNHLLFIVNLIPAHPLDGARVLRAVLWRAVGFRLAGRLTARGAMATAGLMLIGAILLRSHDYAYATMPLVMLSVVLYFSARQELLTWSRPETADPGAIATKRDVVAQADSPGIDLAKEDGASWRAEPLPQPDPPRPRAVSLPKSAAPSDEHDEDRRVDEILARLHQQGLDRLTADERALLQRASQRYRNRPPRS